MPYWNNPYFKNHRCLKLLLMNAKHYNIALSKNKQRASLSPMEYLLRPIFFNGPIMNIFELQPAILNKKCQGNRTEFGIWIGWKQFSISDVRAYFQTHEKQVGIDSNLDCSRFLLVPYKCRFFFWETQT